MAKENELLNWLTKFDESDLRKKVLIPLFEKMGFQDIYDYHHAGEIGKDIVMWKPEGISERTDYAVIVKAIKITGTASGKNSAAEVCFQIQQASGSTYLDPVNGVDRKATRFVVVTPHQIRPEAINAIKASLQPQRLDSVTQFFHGTKLINLIKQYLPSIGLLDSAKETHDQLRKALSAEKLVIESTEDVTRYQVFLKPDTDDSLLGGNINFRFLDDEAGKTKKAYDDFIKRGKPFEIERDSIRSVDLPKILAPLINEKLRLSKIIISPALKNKPLKATLHIENENSYELTSLEFICTNAGTEEFSLTNEQQNLPIKYTLRFNLKKQTVNMAYNYEVSYVEMDCFQIFKYERFIYGLSLGGSIKLIDDDSGLCLATMTVPRNDKMVKRSDWIRLLEKLSNIQLHLNKPIFLPQRALTTDEIRLINNAYEAIFHKKVYLSPGTLSMSLSGKKEDLIKKIGGKAGEFKLHIQKEQIITLFGITLSLGKPIIIIPDYRFKEADLTEKENLGDVCVLSISFDENTKGYFDYS